MFEKPFDFEGRIEFHCLRGETGSVNVSHLHILGVCHVGPRQGPLKLIRLVLQPFRQGSVLALTQRNIRQPTARHHL